MRSSRIASGAGVATEGSLTMDWDRQTARVLVTGGAGFLGHRVVERLRQVGYQRIVVPRSRDYDLRDAAQVERLFAEHRPELVLHLAATVGGIGANRREPGRFLYDNALMGLHVIEACRRHAVRKALTVGSICGYPKHAPVPFREEDLWNGYPEETNAPYGLAKKLLLVQSQGYRQQYGLQAVFVLMVNLYGPRDNFDLETSHVIPALIRKCLEAKATGLPVIECWGDGSPTREFLYVEDAAEAVVLALERYDGAEPVNIGSGQEIAVKELVALIARLTGFTGAIQWDASKPNGQPRRRLDVSRAKAAFGFAACTPLEEGLRRTIAWYEAQRRQSVMQAGSVS